MMRGQNRRTRSILAPMEQLTQRGSDMSILDQSPDELNAIEKCIKVILHVTRNGECVHDREGDRGRNVVWKLGDLSVARNLDSVSLLFKRKDGESDSVQLTLEQVRVWEEVDAIYGAMVSEETT